MQETQLLYHSDSPKLYSTNTPSSLITVRFASPVRITSIRVTPEGVASPTGSGTTYPPSWTGEMFLNASDASPVNALEKREVVYAGGEWPVEYEIDMPEDVTTRLISLLAPVQSISLSIYGYNAAGPSTPPPPQPTLPALEKEDWSWVSTWAGGVDGLIDLLGSNAYEDVKERAVQCLLLLEEERGGIIPQLLGNEAAVSHVLNRARDPTLADLTFDNSTYALHPNIKSAISTSHPLYDLIAITGHRQRRAAWRHLDRGVSLHVLAQVKEADVLSVEEGMEKSNLARLLEVAERIVSDDQEKYQGRLGLILDILEGPHTDPILLSHLAGMLPRLTLVSNIRTGGTRPINLPPTYAPVAARSLLLCSSDLVGTTPAYSMAQRLVQPYLSHLSADSPYHTIFASTPPSLPTPAESSTADSRRLSRLSASLSSSTPSAFLHTATPAEIVSLLAPALYTLLSTAPVPLLDIPSALANPTPESQASAWAGKVYTSNEFREREEARVGLGIKSAKTGQLAVLGGAGLGPGAGAGLGADGLPARISRPASRHVDDFGR